MMIRSIRLLLTFSLLLTAFSCIEKIQIATPDKETGIMVIQGKLSIAEKGYAQVYISRSFSFSTYTADPRDELKAAVKLLDDEGNSIQLTGGLLDGYYRATFDLNTSPLKITPGTKYQLKVKTTTNKEYISTLEEMPELPHPEFLSIKKINKEVVLNHDFSETKDFLQLSITSPLMTASSNKNRRLAWGIYSTYKQTDTPSYCPFAEYTGIAPKACYINSLEHIQGNLFFDGTTASIPKLENHILFDQLIFNKFAEGLYFTVVQQSLNRKAFEYLKNIQLLLERSGSMFDPLPGLVSSNFKNTADEQEKVYGYFYPSMEDTLRIYVSPEIAGYPTYDCPAHIPDNQSLPNQCCDCLLSPGSSLKKPFFWEE